MDAALLTDLQRMFVKIRLAAWKADESDERKTRGVAPAQAYPWDWTPEHTFKLPNKCAGKYPINMHGNSVELQLALADWLANLEWCEDRRVSHMELIMDFEIRSGLDFLYSQADYEEKLETAPVDVNPADSDPRHGSPPGAESSPKSEGVKDEEEEGVDTSSADGSSGSRHEGAVETRAQRWFDASASIGRCGRRYLAKEHVAPSDPPRKAPANAVRGTANTHHCAGHHKPMCRSCEASKGRLHTLAVCCYEHHRDDDGCPPIWDFCGSHRLTRCGKCIHNPTRPQLASCCRNHHAQVGQRRISSMFAPRARPAEGADPNNRDPADARVGGTPHTADPHS